MFIIASKYDSSTSALLDNPYVELYDPRIPGSLEVALNKIIYRFNRKKYLGLISSHRVHLILISMHYYSICLCAIKSFFVFRSIIYLGVLIYPQLIIRKNNKFIV